MRKKAVKTKEYEGYLASDIDDLMEETGLTEDWKEFIFGAAVGVVEGKAVVYKWDFDKFMADIRDRNKKR